MISRKGLERRLFVMGKGIKAFSQSINALFCKSLTIEEIVGKRLDLFSLSQPIPETENGVFYAVCIQL